MIDANSSRHIKNRNIISSYSRTNCAQNSVRVVLAFSLHFSSISLIKTLSVNNSNTHNQFQVVDKQKLTENGHVIEDNRIWHETCHFSKVLMAVNHIFLWQEKDKEVKNFNNQLLIEMTFSGRDVSSLPAGAPPTFLLSESFLLLSLVTKK